jgi:hypothetical protein
MVEEFSVRARLAHQLNSVRHQDRDGHVVEQVAANPAEQCLSQRRVVVGLRHDRVGAQIGGARQQDIGDRDVTGGLSSGCALTPCRCRCRITRSGRGRSRSRSPSIGAWTQSLPCSA